MSNNYDGDPELEIRAEVTYSSGIRVLWTLEDQTTTVREVASYLLGIRTGLAIEREVDVLDVYLPGFSVFVYPPEGEEESTDYDDAGTYLEILLVTGQQANS